MTTEHMPEDERQCSYRRVRRFYQIAAQREWDRLLNPAEGALEFIINKRYIARHMPAAARVLDLGGGPGRYTIWLASLGHRVTLADLSPDLLDMAREKIAEAGVEKGVEAIVEANATDLSMFGDGQFDAVLCLGPLYHLILEEDRRAAGRELFRVLRLGGLVFAAFLPRLQVLRVGLSEELPWFTPYTFDLVKRWLDEGIFLSPVPGIFTDAHFVWPREVSSLMEGAGFETISLISSESVAADVQRQLFSFAERQPELYEWLLERIIEVADDPTVVGMAYHLLYIGRKP